MIRSALLVLGSRCALLLPGLPRTLLTLMVLAAVHASAVAASAEDPCATFTWNVGHERSLFSGSPESVKAGVDSSAAPRLATDRLYALSLAPVGRVHFPVAPSSKKSSDGGFGGLARLRVSQPGVYRLSLDQPFWVEVVSGGQLLALGEHQGRSGCNAPHKILQFALPADTDLMIEVIGTLGSQAKMTITRTPVHGS